MHGHKGYCLIDCQLYMPKKWFSDDYQDLRQENLVPEDLSFQTKQEIGLELITRASQKFPARWIGCDAAFGSDANFLHSLPEGLYYFVDVRKSEKVYLEKPEVGVPQYQGRGRRPSKNKVLSEHQPYKVSELAQSKELIWHPNFEEGKSHLGMDHYEHRSWPAWHRHMIYVMLAMHFLFRLRQRFKKNSRLDSSADKNAAGSRFDQTVNNG